MRKLMRHVPHRKGRSGESRCTVEKDEKDGSLLPRWLLHQREGKRNKTRKKKWPRRGEEMLVRLESFHKAGVAFSPTLTSIFSFLSLALSPSSTFFVTRECESRASVITSSERLLRSSTSFERTTGQRAKATSKILQDYTLWGTFLKVHAYSNLSIWIIRGFQRTRTFCTLNLLIEIAFNFPR